MHKGQQEARYARADSKMLYYLLKTITFTAIGTNTTDRYRRLYTLVICVVRELGIYPTIYHKDKDRPQAHCTHRLSPSLVASQQGREYLRQSSPTPVHPE